MYFDSLCHKTNQVNFKNYDFSPDRARKIIVDLPLLQDEKLKVHLSNRVQALQDYIDFCSISPEIYLTARLLDSKDRPSLARILQIYPKEGNFLTSVFFNDQALFSGAIGGICSSVTGIVFDSPAHGKYEIFFKPLIKEESSKKG